MLVFWFCLLVLMYTLKKPCELTESAQETVIGNTSVHKQRQGDEKRRQRQTNVLKGITRSKI